MKGLDLVDKSLCSAYKRLQKLKASGRLQASPEVDKITAEFSLHLGYTLGCVARLQEYEVGRKRGEEV